MAKKHLEIKLSTDRTEIVDAATIDKLYQLAYEDLDSGIESLLDEISDVLGNILSVSAYEDAVRYLSGIDETDIPRFPNLHITIPNDNYYVRFKDSVIGSILINDFGNEIGATKSLLSSILSTNRRFSALSGGNIDYILAKTFDDLLYLTGLNEWRLLTINGVPDNNENFISASELGVTNNEVKILKYDSITTPKTILYGSDNSNGNACINGGSWKRLLAFDRVDLSNTTFMSSYELNYPIILLNVAAKFENIILPKLTEYHVIIFGTGIFDKIIFPEGVTKICETFSGCAVNYVELPSTLTTVWGIFRSFRQNARQSFGIPAQNSGCLVFKSVTPPTDTNPGIPLWNYINPPNGIYVPDGSVEIYKTWAAEQHENLVSLIKPLSTIPEIYREMGTVTQEDIDRT